MRRSSKFWLAVACSLLIPETVPAQEETPDFEFSFEAPEVVGGVPGETLRFEARVLLTTRNNPTIGAERERGAQGWQLSIGVEGPGVTLQSAAVEGMAGFELPPCADDSSVTSTAVAGVVDPEIIANPDGSALRGQSEIPVGEPQGQGAVSAAVFPFGQFFPEGVVDETLNCPPPGSPGGSFSVELDPEGTVSVLRLTLECTAPSEEGSCENVRLFFINGKKGIGQPLKNLVTFERQSVVPTTTEAVVQCCALPAPDFDFSFQAPEIVGVLPGETLAFEARVLLTSRNNPTIGTAKERGAQGWQLSIGVEGAGAALQSATVEGMAGFELPPCADDSTVTSSAVAQVVDPEVIANPDGSALKGQSEIPAGEPQGQGAVAAAVFPFGQFFPEGVIDETLNCPPPGSPGGAFSVELDPEGTVSVLKLTLECTAPSEEGSCENVRLFFVNGKKGTGQQLKNLVTFRGESIVPTRTEAVIQCCSLGNIVGPFVRGDCNANGLVKDEAITDAIASLEFNFTGDFNPPCLAACDANKDGEVVGTVADAIYILAGAFVGGPLPPAPFPTAGISSDPGDLALGCELTTSS